MSWTLIRQATPQFLSSVNSAPFTIVAPANANIVAVFVASRASTGTNPRTVSGITCTNVTFAKLTSGVSGNINVWGSEIWIGLAAASAGTALTVSMSATCADLAVCVAEFSGGTSTSDAIVGGTSGNSTAPTTNAYTVNTQGSLILTMLQNGNASISAGPGGFTALTAAGGSSTGGTVDKCAPYYQLSANVGAASAATWTQATSSWITTIGGLKLGAAASANWLKETYWWNRNRNSGRS